MRSRLWLAGVTAVMVVLTGLTGARAQTPFESAERAHASIFMYHRFDDDRYPATSTSLEDFKAHIAHLKSGGFTVLSLSEIVAALKAGRPLPDKTVAITIDDAFQSFAEKAWPLLRRANMPATLFVSTKALDEGGEDFVSWDTLRRMAAQGLEIGNHTVSHPHLPTVSASDLHAEITRAQARIKAEIGVEPTVFAYPYGEFGTREEKMVRDLGFEAAFGQQSGVAHAGEALTRLPRFSVSGKSGRMTRFTVAAEALPLAASDVTPKDWVIRSDKNNPPHFGFTVAEGVKQLDALVCYSGSGEKVEPVRLGPSRFEIRPTKKLSQGRSRINCTVPGVKSGSGVRWRWRGVQFTVIED